MQKTSDRSGESPSSTATSNKEKWSKKKQLAVSSGEGLEQKAGGENCDSALGWLNRCMNATFLRFMYHFSHPSVHFLSLNPGSSSRGSRLNRDAQTFPSPANWTGSSGGIPKAVPGQQRIFNLSLHSQL